MPDEPKGFWAKFAVVASFLTAVGTIAQLCSTPNKQTNIPDNVNSKTQEQSTTYTSSNGIARYCCDTHSGNRLCKLGVTAPIGQLCSCPGIARLVDFKTCL